MLWKTFQITDKREHIIKIGDDITIEIKKGSRSNNAIVGIDAPKDVKIKYEKKETAEE